MAEPGSPFPLPDECLDSFLIRNKLLNQTAESFFSVPPINASARIDPGGYSNAQERVWRLPALANLNRRDQIKLSYHDFFKPFREAKRPFGDPIEGTRRIIFRGGSVPEYCASEIKVVPALCTECTAGDFERRGYSYWRRKHQIRCNLVCDEHRSWLRTSCPHCGHQFSLRHIPSFSCKCCNQDPIITCAETQFDETMLDVFSRIAKCVELIFAGDIRQSLNLVKMGEYIHSTVPSRTPNTFNNIARHIRNTVDESKLRSLAAHPSVRPAFGWPATYLSERWDEARPTFDLLLFGVFGRGLNIDEYWSQDWPKGPERKSIQNKQFDHQFLRHIYHAKTWYASAESMSLSIGHVANIYGGYPGLKKRVERFRKGRRYSLNRSNT